MMAKELSDGQNGKRSGKVIQFALVMGCTVWLLCLIDHKLLDQRNRGNEQNMSVKKSAMNTLGRKVEATSASVSPLESEKTETKEVFNVKIQENEEDEELSFNEAKEDSLLGEGGIRVAPIIKKTGAGNDVRDGSVYRGQVFFQDEDGVPPDMRGVYLQKS